ncbi:hypothetical protein [Streptomyces caatingaensis]|uniref:PsbP C-terminal domain-containing protein n=1 Tax=Streptomyces caatingaensis TaxID=1678637 RepID=A0A0K9X9V1_9ACTN|nr:hypothetical protein [Streptomyces caatingaensis]KNB49437.1 hypothetical protein AC230_29785 [Streptomyces caatingaensis]
MTTPTPLPPPFPPAPPLPPAPARRARPVVLVALLVLLLAGGGATAWWLSRDTDGAPLAGRPRVTDERAGLSYAIPDGWKSNGSKRLIDAFSSAIGSPRGTVLAGPSRPVPEPRLRTVTERAARSNAEFFYPDRAVRLEESRPEEVGGRPAHTVALAVDAEGGRVAHLRMTVVASDDRRAAFLLGIATSGAPDDVREVDAVLRSASLGD